MSPFFTVFFTEERPLVPITEPSNDDYGNDVSDNCDNDFGTFDDFGETRNAKTKMALNQFCMM